MDRAQLLDEWAELKAAIKQHWAKVTDQDLSRFDATLAELAGVLQDRYGLSKESARGDVREFFAKLRAGLADTASQVREAAGDAWDRGRDRVRAGIEAGRDRINEKPLQSLALAAGVGALIAWLLRRR